MRRISKKLILTVLVLTVVALCALGFVACSPDGGGDGTETVTDLIGREVSVTPGAYERVVCVGAGALRMYCYVGDVNLLAGIEDIDNTSRANRPKMFDASARPYVLANAEVFSSIENSCGVGGPQAQNAESEKILQCNPDIVISEYKDVDKANALQRQLGVPVITVSSGADGVFSNDVKTSFTLLGKIFGKEDRASALNAFIASETDKISQRTQNIEESDKKSVYICGLGNWGTTNHLMTAKNYKPFEIAHVKNAVTDIASNAIGLIEKEKFEALAGDVDVMIIDSAAVKNIRPLYGEDPAMFDGVKAVADGEVYLQMAYNAYYTNLEIALINTWFIAKTVYPDKFLDIDMTEKTNEVTRAFLGKDLANEIFACEASFGGYRKIDVATFFA